MKALQNTDKWLAATELELKLKQVSTRVTMSAGTGSVFQSASYLYNWFSPFQVPHKSATYATLNDGKVVKHKH